ncbi:MAG: hypothetical protein M2R45_02790 [Verrucomicrobia subdivision 3 bacterium]|nr:hypothetical protein [Limisphaerales bacterium]
MSQLRHHFPRGTCDQHDEDQTDNQKNSPEQAHLLVLPVAKNEERSGELAVSIAELWNVVLFAVGQAAINGALLLARLTIGAIFFNSSEDRASITPPQK